MRLQVGRIVGGASGLDEPAIAFELGDVSGGLFEVFGLVGEGFGELDNVFCFGEQHLFQFELLSRDGR